ncbi:hypothetical protein HDV05_004749, partial [Chytridiales sp. JEL 0842]
MAQPVDNLDPAVVEELAAVLADLSAQNNDVRNAAENTLQRNWRDTRVDLLLAALVQILRSHPNVQIRSLSSILLRRVATKPPSYSEGSPAAAALKAQSQALGADVEPPTVWASAPENVRQFCQVQLLHSFNEETDASVRHKVCDTIAEIARENMNIEAPWNDLRSTVFESVKSASPLHREAALRIIGTLPSLISDQSSVSVQVVIATFADCLAVPNADVRVAALQASVGYMLEMLIPDDMTAEAPASLRNALAQLIPSMLNALVNLDNEEKVVEGLSFLVDLAQAEARMFRNFLPDLLEYLTSLMNNENAEPSTRHTALELLLTLAESRPAMIRKLPQFTSVLVPLLLNWMATIEDSQAWHETDDLSQDDDDNDEDYIVAEQALDRLSIALGGKSILSVSFVVIPKFLGSEEWQKRHAGLMAVSVMGEGCRELMMESLEQVVRLVLPYLRDAHPRVRYAACNAVGQMCTDFAPVMQRKFNDDILSHMVPLMEDVANPRVQAHCAAALVNFMEDAEKLQVGKYLDDVVAKLVGLLGSNKTYVQEQVITTIATVADCSADMFVQYNNTIMPLLLNILRNATDKRYRLLRGKALECASLIGLAVGKEHFIQYAPELLQLLQEIQQTPMESDDPVASYLLCGWARVCKVIGVDFVPYLGIVMPPLLASAQVKPEFAVIDNEDSMENYSEDEGWEFINVDGQKFGIKTNVLEDKHTAVEMLSTYARDLKEHFVPWVSKVLETVVPLLKFIFHEGVRHAAASTVPLLFRCLKAANTPTQEIAQYWNPVVVKIMEAMMADQDPEFLSHIYTAYSE